MKSIARFLIHPVTVCLLFCCLIISGRQSAVMYGFVLLIGITHSVFHAILGVTGITLLLISVIAINRTIKSFLDLGGVLCLIVSLTRFFLQPKGDYNYNTFRESVPLFLLILFACILLLNIIHHLRRLNAP